MIFKIHYGLTFAGICAIGILLGVYMETYTDASALEIGILYMLVPFVSIIFRSIVCSMADRGQAHKKYMITSLAIYGASYVPYATIPFLGPEVYVNHARFCWYFLASAKFIGTMACGVIFSVGDTLAMNYARRIGTEFSEYRLWGTISWMLFGLLIGKINDIYFCPKYVPAFIILIITSVVNLILFWLWPDEYFVIVNAEKLKKTEESKQEEKKKQVKSLMTSSEIWCHMKKKLVASLIFKSDKPKLQLELGDTQSKPDQQVVKRDIVKDPPVGKMAQLRLLFQLFLYDPRIILYFIFFVAAGFTTAPMGFFFMHLSSICDPADSCYFSMMVGAAQFVMAASEFIYFAYVKQLRAFFGRLNLCAVALLLMSMKFLFYGTIWTSVSPYYFLVAEIAHGVAFGIYLTLLVELSYSFAHEAEYVVPKLIARGIVNEGQEADKLKLSLVATMQSLVAGAMEGLGAGFGSLVYGLILRTHSYTELWLIIGSGSSIIFTVTLVCSVLNTFFGVRLGSKIKKDAEIEKEIEKEPRKEQA